ncbi:MAG: aldo/keto reductase [Candidatus Dormibacteria bacterium]
MSTTAGKKLSSATLGRTTYDITRVGLGAWAIGGGDWQGGWGPQDDKESVAAIHHAIELGVNWIDTAPAYGLGHAEEVVGQALRQLPQSERPLVFTKCGLVWKGGERTVSNVLSPESIRAECEASLRRLGFEAIDLLQIHWPGEDGTPIEESWGTMGALVDEGKVRHIGVSNFGVDLLEKCEAIRHVDTVQPQVNLLVRAALDEILPWAERNGCGVVAYSPMRSGLLTGAFSSERAGSLAEDDWRREDADFKEPRLSANLCLVEKLRATADRLGCSLPELAVAWTLACPGVTAAIVGARRPEQVEGWIGGATVDLAESDLEEISSALESTGAGEGPQRPVR